MFDLTECEARAVLRSSASTTTAWPLALAARRLIEDWSIEPAAADVVVAALGDDEHGSEEFAALLAKLVSRDLLRTGAQKAILDGLHGLLDK